MTDPPPTPRDPAHVALELLGRARRDLDEAIRLLDDGDVSSADGKTLPVLLDDERRSVDEARAALRM